MLKKEKNKKEINLFKNVPKVFDLITPEIVQEKVDYIKLGYNKFSRIFVY